MKSKGINPEFVSTQQKISHAKSAAFLQWKKSHQFESVIDETITTDHNVTQKKKGEYSKSVSAHKEIKTSRGPGSHNESKGSQTTQLTPEETELQEGGFKRIATDREEDARLKKMSALDKFRADAKAREKKHAEIQKNQIGRAHV